ncbi:MAG TPA: hypothetical protein VIQ24_02860 [Pyrinomonadaceae bacterium]
MSWNFLTDGGTRALDKRLFCDGRSEARLTRPRQIVPGRYVRRFRLSGKAI